MNQQYPSILLEKAVGEFSKLPGIGRKTAMRLVLHLLRQDTATVEAFGNSIMTLKREVKYCKVCHNISDTEICQICANPQRDASTICVVENIRDVMAVEAISGALSCFRRSHFSNGRSGTERPSD
jgi:recombination protein RecR